MTSEIVVIDAPELKLIEESKAKQITLTYKSLACYKMRAFGGKNN